MVCGTTTTTTTTTTTKTTAIFNKKIKERFTAGVSGVTANTRGRLILN